MRISDWSSDVCSSDLRVPKYHLRIETYGTVDELNSYVGLIRDQDISNDQKELLKEIQDRLFTIGASLASDPEKSKMKVPDLKSEIGRASCRERVVSVRLDLGGRRIIKKKIKNY